jgi:hypothetical protein
MRTPGDVGTQIPASPSHVINELWRFFGNLKFRAEANRHISQFRPLIRTQRQFSQKSEICGQPGAQIIKDAQRSVPLGILII